MGQLRSIEKAIRRKITRKSVPTLTDVIAGNQRTAIESLQETAQNLGLEEYRENAEDLLNNIDSVSLVAAAIKLLTKQPDVTPVKITEEAPQRKKRHDGKKRNFRSKDKRRDDKPRNHDRRMKNDKKHFHDKKKSKKSHVHESSFKPYFKD